MNAKEVDRHRRGPGNSVSGDEVTVIYDSEDGQVLAVPIGEFVDQFVQPSSGSSEMGNRYFALSFDGRHLKPNWSRIRAVHRHEVREDLYAVETEVGRNIAVTPDHSVLAFDGFAIGEVTPNEMRVGSFWLIGPRNYCGPVTYDGNGRSDLIALALADGLSMGEEVVVYGDSPTIAGLAFKSNIALESNDRFAVIRDQEISAGLRAGFGCFLSMSRESRLVALREFFDKASFRTAEDKRLIFADEGMELQIGSVLPLLGVQVHHIRYGRVEVDEQSLARAISSFEHDGDSDNRRLSAFGDAIKEERLRKRIWRSEMSQSTGICASRLRSIEMGDDPTEAEVQAIVSALGRSEALDVLLNPHIYLERVVSVRRIGRTERRVYDLSVEKNENFTANGVFVHNSTSVKNSSTHLSP